MRLPLGIVAVVSLGVAAQAAACSSSDSTPSAPVDAGVPEAAPIDSGGTDAGGGDDASACAKDIDVDGLYKHLACTGIESGVAFKPANEFWSDGAEKSRWVYLPAGAKIDITDFDEWVYPNGMKLWKEFKVDGKKVETRLFAKGDDGTWRHTVYRWNDAETEAVKKTIGELLPPNGTRTSTYEIPNTTQCNACHDGRKEPVLGFDAMGLGVSGATGMTLAMLASDGRFTVTPPTTTITIPEDSTTKAAAALGWLHANCGHCHNDNSGAYALYAKPKFIIKPSDIADAGAVTTMRAWTSSVCVAANGLNPDGGTAIKIIEKMQPDNSLAVILSGQRNPEGTDPDTRQMPPMVTRRVDTVGHQKLVDWVAALPDPCN